MAARTALGCRLDWYAAKGSLAARQLEAGLRFRADFLAAAGAPRIVGHYGPKQQAGPRGDGLSFGERQMAARGRVRRALDALPPDGVAAIVAVAGLDEWAGPRLPALKAALAVLADGYGLPKP